MHLKIRDNTFYIITIGGAIIASFFFFILSCFGNNEIVLEETGYVTWKNLLPILQQFQNTITLAHIGYLSLGITIILFFVGIFSWIQIKPLRDDIKIAKKEIEKIKKLRDELKELKNEIRLLKDRSVVEFLQIQADSSRAISLATDPDYKGSYAARFKWDLRAFNYWNRLSREWGQDNFIREKNVIDRLIDVLQKAKEDISLNKELKELIDQDKDDVLKYLSRIYEDHRYILEAKEIDELMRNLDEKLTGLKS